MTVETRPSDRPLSEDEVRDLERRLEVVFPPDYAAFLRAHNGGRPDPNVLVVDGVPNNNVAVMMWLGSEGDYSLVKESEWLTRRSRALRDLLPIAEAEGGNRICLLRSGKPGVFFWDHATNQISKIADTFDELLTNLRPASEVPLPPPKPSKVWIDPEFEPELDKYRKK